MIPTKQNVMDAARFYLADDQVAGGEVFTNTILEAPFQMSYRELFRAMQGLANPRVVREAYYDLPVNTGYLSPATAFITDMGEVESVEERGALTSVSITGATAGSGFVTIAATAHPFATGNVAVVFGVTGMTGLTGQWGVTKVDANSFKINGAVGIGAYVSGGTATLSTDSFTPMVPVERITDSTGATDTLGIFAWFEDAFHFPICTTIRELRIVYLSSASTVVGASDTTGVDDSLDFLAIRTAGLAASSRGARDRAGELNMMALGQNGQADGTGGILRELIAVAVRALQANPVRRPPFRQRFPGDVTDFL